ncbi:hypothetical protein B0T20DRAFT_394522 [Sordaria brevicollis]|uniref:Uncharacterized protein n=1 Tax=Sordaria brevicollis TaxID=83679 RepID=A0AAE0PDA5_SORBR|nr:hypothetical protein B0T20DRAFT_394522 [Sordaria brevicollis]
MSFRTYLKNFFYFFRPGVWKYATKFGIRIFLIFFSTLQRKSISRYVRNDIKGGIIFGFIGRRFVIIFPVFIGNPFIGGIFNYIINNTYKYKKVRGYLIAGLRG